MQNEILGADTEDQPSSISICCWKAGLCAQFKPPDEEHLQILLDWKKTTHQEHCRLHLLRFLILQPTKIPANSKSPLLKIKIHNTDSIQKLRQNRFKEFCHNPRTYNLRAAYYSGRRKKKSQKITLCNTWFLADTWKRTCILIRKRSYPYHATRIPACKHHSVTDVYGQI